MTLPWYKDGLRFKCTECGKCCTGQSGYVWLSDSEAEEMAKQLDLTVKEFKMRYVRIREKKMALVEKKNSSGTYDCVFLKDNKCQVYKARPSQCKTYPWWPENLNNEASWNIAAQECEGIDPEADLITLEQINKNLGES